MIQKIWRALTGHPPRGKRNRQQAESSQQEAASTAAVPGGPEPDTLHPGRHRIKEVFTHHWDLDYLTEDQLKALEEQSRK